MHNTKNCLKEWDTKLYDIKYSNLIQIIYAQFQGSSIPDINNLQAIMFSSLYAPTKNRLKEWDT